MEDKIVYVVEQTIGESSMVMGVPDKIIGVASTVERAVEMARDSTFRGVRWSMSEAQVVEMLKNSALCKFTCDDDSRYKLEGFRIDERGRART